MIKISLQKNVHFLYNSCQLHVKSHEFASNPQEFQQTVSIYHISFILKTSLFSLSVFGINVRIIYTENKTWAREITTIKSNDGCFFFLNTYFCKNVWHITARLNNDQQINRNMKPSHSRVSGYKNSAEYESSSTRHLLWYFYLMVWILGGGQHSVCWLVSSWNWATGLLLENLRIWNVFLSTLRWCGFYFHRFCANNRKHNGVNEVLFQVLKALKKALPQNQHHSFQRSHFLRLKDKYYCEKCPQRKSADCPDEPFWKEAVKCVRCQISNTTREISFPSAAASWS